MLDTSKVKLVSVDLDAELHRKFRVRCLERGTTMAGVLRDAAILYVSSGKIPWTKTVAQNDEPGLVNAGVESSERREAR
jgi:ParG